MDHAQPKTLLFDESEFLSLNGTPLRRYKTLILQNFTAQLVSYILFHREVERLVTNQAVSIEGDIAEFRKTRHFNLFIF